MVVINLVSVGGNYILGKLFSHLEELVFDIERNEHSSGLLKLLYEGIDLALKSSLYAILEVLLEEHSKSSIVKLKEHSKYFIKF